MHSQSKPGLSLGQLLFAGIVIAFAISFVCCQIDPRKFKELEYSPTFQQWTGR